MQSVFRQHHVAAVRPRTVSVQPHRLLSIARAVAAPTISAPTREEELTSLRQLLMRAGRTTQEDPEVVEKALTRLEALSSPVTPGDDVTIDGRWHLVFSTATKIRAFQYIPVREELVIDSASKRIALESSVGPFRFHINGQILGWEGATRCLEFQFVQVDIFFQSKKIKEIKPKTKSKTYTFYYVTKALAAARSSAGGLSLLMGQ